MLDSMTSRRGKCIVIFRKKTKCINHAYMSCVICIVAIDTLQGRVPRLL